MLVAERGLRLGYPSIIFFEFISNRGFNQVMPQLADCLFGQAGLGCQRLCIGDYLGFACLIAHMTALRLDAGGGIHIVKAAAQQRDQFAIDLIDAGADVGHGGAFWSGKDRHVRALTGRRAAVQLDLQRPSV